jgi:Polysaccharide deacetylase
MTIEYLRHLVATKGVLHALKRVGQIANRFSRGEKRFGEMISFLESNHDFQSVKITFCVTACLLQRHQRVVNQLQQLGHDIASHGYFHTDMRRKSNAEQSAIIRRTYQAFSDAKLPVIGFRCPYLSYNNHTIEALKASDYAWTSHDLIFWDTDGYDHNYDKNGLRRLLKLYHALPAKQTLSLPNLSTGLVDIPITAPDDEMLVERYRVRDPKTISEIWVGILEKTHQRGELFHLLFHPERFDRLSHTMAKLSRRAKELEPSVWITSLGELSKWWEERSSSKWILEQSGSGERMAWIRTPRGATVLTKSEGLPGGTSAVYKTYYPAKPAADRHGALAYCAGRSKRSTIGVSKQCSKKMIEFLSGEGFCVEESDEPALHSFYLDGSETFTDRDKLSLLDKLDSSRAPLLRLWRWPNGARSAFVISADVDSITVADFLRRALHF